MLPPSPPPPPRLDAMADRVARIRRRRALRAGFLVVVLCGSRVPIWIRSTDHGVSRSEWAFRMTHVNGD